VIETREGVDVMSTFPDDDQKISDSGQEIADSTSSSTVERLLKNLTLGEKVSLLHGSPDPRKLGQAGYLAGVGRLCIPSLRLCDASAGLNLIRDATCLPASVSIAATFSPELAEQYGKVLGCEARALEQDVVLVPQINVVRVPQFTRSKDTLGEDPFLIGQIAAAYIKGIQDQKVMAVAKHFIANNQNYGEAGSAAMDFRVDDQTLHEIYLAGFEQAVRSKVAVIMTAYNHINGFWNSENPGTLLGLLRHELGFTGFTCSDWGGTHSTVPAITAGLDVEMPGYVYGLAGMPPLPAYFREELEQKVNSGEVPMATVDEAVRRVLGQMEVFGLFDKSRLPGPFSVDVAAGARTAREVAVAGAVLLRNVPNESGDCALPLSLDELGSLVVIGPTAGQLAAGAGGERAYGFPERLISPLEALRDAAEKAGKGDEIKYAVGVDLTGCPVPSAVLKTEQDKLGLTRTTDGTFTCVDPTVDFTGPDALSGGETYTWTGAIVIPANGDYPPEGDYDLKIQSWGGTATLEVDGVKVASSAVDRDGIVRPWSSLLPTTDGLDNGQAPTQHLKAGDRHTIRITATRITATDVSPDRLQIRFAWVTPKKREDDKKEAVELAARKAGKVVVFAFDGHGGIIAGAGGDRTTLSLPNQQDKLICAVAEANPKTVVVLNTGWPVTMPWLSQIRSVLQMWYPGQEGGWATADLLLGTVSPSGKLPVTFPANDSNMPAGPRDTPEHSPHPERYWGVDGVVTYSEGMFVGYRWYDKKGIEPLFPFGHGLSYTSFEYSKLKVRQVDNGLDVSFTVHNTGTRPGTEVPQVYVGPPPHSAVPQSMAPWVLAGFQRIKLARDEEQSVTIHVEERQLSYWSTHEHRWVLATGNRPVRVGSSSRDIRLPPAISD
jgi:beta-glucosidase